MMDFTVFTQIVTDLEGVITFLIIFGLSFLFMSQIVAWVTPPNPKFLHAIALGTVAGAFVVFVIYTQIPLVPALIRASISGVYGNTGYLWSMSILFLMAIFGLNTVNSWKENKPLEIIQ